MGKKKNGEKEVKDAEIIEVKKEAISVYNDERKSVESMITSAIKANAPVETMEKVMAMRRELKAEYAKEQFDLAMSGFQSECPEIKKTTAGGKTKSGEVAYHYATIDSIVNQVKPMLGKFGLSFLIKTEIGKGTVKSICIVRHVAGHSETSEMEVPLSTQTGVMSNAQVTAATSTFSKRYAFMNAFGIMTGDEDKEDNIKDASNDEISDAIMRLDNCTRDKEVVDLWDGFSKEVRANQTVVEKTGGMRRLIQDANNQK